MTADSNTPLLDLQLRLIAELETAIPRLGQQPAATLSANKLLPKLAELAALAIRQQETCAAASQREALMTLILEGSGTGTWDRDFVTDTVSYSSGWASLLGFSEQLQSTLQEAVERIHPDDRPAVELAMREIKEGRRSVYEVEHRIRCGDGDYRWIHSRGRVISRDANGRALRMVGVTNDVTKRKAAEAALRELATRDALTGLANRRHFLAAMEQELARLQRAPDRSAALLMCDLDHFKKVNDGYGHAVGDRALVHFADLIRRELRQTDSAGRLGGEEFAVLLVDATPTDAERFAERLRERLASHPLPLAQGELRLTVSIGIAALRGEDGDIEAALLNSDAALYRAKAEGRNRVEVSQLPPAGSSLPPQNR